MRIKQEEKKIEDDMKYLKYRATKKLKESAIGFLLKWLEGDIIVGPSLGCFVLAMLNKNNFHTVQSIYGINDFKQFEKLHYKQRFIYILDSPPDFTKYSANHTSLKNIVDGLHSSVFGGSVLNDVDGKPNSLREQICQVPIDLSTGGALY